MIKRFKQFITEGKKNIFMTDDPKILKVGQKAYSEQFKKLKGKSKEELLKIVDKSGIKMMKEYRDLYDVKALKAWICDKARDDLIGKEIKKKEKIVKK